VIQLAYFSTNCTTTVQAEAAEMISDGTLYRIETNDDQDFTKSAEHEEFLSSHLSL
jgi:hypothetical protein